MTAQFTKVRRPLFGRAWISIVGSAIALSACQGVSLGGSSSAAAPLKTGYLCCNMRTDGSWISDINYQEPGKRVIPVGTPVKLTSYGRSRAAIEVEGETKTQYLGNDYSRGLSNEAFAARFVVSEDPRKEIAGYPEKIRTAITAGKIMKGMTRDQVIMSLGWPVHSENPDIEAEGWRFWRSSFAEISVFFDAKGQVSEIEADRITKSQMIQR